MSHPYQEYMKREIEIKRYSMAAMSFLAAKDDIGIILDNKFNKSFTEIIDREFSNKEDFKSSFRQIQFEYLVCFCVDNLNNYLADTLRFIFLSKPETLRSSDKIEVSEVLKYNTIEEFAGYLAIKKADELTYGGIERMKKYMIDTIGLKLITSPEDSEILSRAVAFRNVIVHNRGKVNERYMKETNNKDLQLGERLSIEKNDIVEIWKSLPRIAELINEAVSEKYGKDIFIKGR